MDLEKIAKENGIELEKLKRLYNDLQQKFSEYEGEKKEKMVRKGILNYVNWLQRMGLQQFFGIILIATQPRHSTARRRREALEFYESSPEEAVQKGIVEEITKAENGYISRKVDKNGVIHTKPIKEVPDNALVSGDKWVVPLNSMRTFPSGATNWNYLKPLPAEQYFMNIEGICVKAGESEFLPFRATLNLDTNDVQLPLNKPVKFLATVRSKDSKGYTLSVRNDTKFEEISDVDMETIKPLVQKFYEETPIPNLYEKYEEVKGTYQTISIKGQVADIIVRRPTEDNPKPWSMVIVSDEDTDEEVRVICHPGLDVSFGINSIVKVWGSPVLSKRWDPELRATTDEDELVVFASGIYPLIYFGPEEEPEQIKREDVVEEVVEDDEEDEWEM